MRLTSLAVLALSLGACVHRQHVSPPDVSEQWTVALVSARRSAAQGHYRELDRTLAEFVRAHPGTDEADESAFWRALFKLDPQNRDSSPSEAIGALDVYLGMPGELHHREEALILRRSAALAQSLAAEANAARPAATPDKAKDEELQRLRDELAKTQAELDRIKRRVAAPKP
jgi:hypothetical protein